MRKQVFVSLSAGTLVMTVMAGAPVGVEAQQAPPPSAFVNREERAVQEAARQAFPTRPHRRIRTSGDGTDPIQSMERD